jgi:hypothetical protein
MDLPSDDALRWIVRTYARLLAAHGEAIGAPALVQPTGAFFPDVFCGDAPSVERLVRRLMTYAPIAEDLHVELAFLAAEGEVGGGCGSSACASGSRPALGLRAIEEMDGGYRVFVASGDLGHPELLTACLARGVGALVLSEAGDDEDSETAAPTAEIAAVACGLGVLLTNGAAVWAKSCGGLRMARATSLSVEETAVALSLFVAVHGVRPSEARGHLGSTQREAFDLALAWTESNVALVEKLKDHAALLEAGTFDIEPVRGLFGRWLHKRKIDSELRSMQRIVRRPPSAERKRRLEEARALVNEVLGGETSEN